MKVGPLKITADNIVPWLGIGIAEIRNFVRERFGGLDRREQRVLDYVRANVAPGDPDAVLAAMDDFARNDVFLMNVGDKKGEILDGAVRESAAGQVLELGAFCGYSAVRIARLLDKPGSLLTSVELSKTRCRVVEEMVAHAGLSDRVSVVNGATSEVIPTLEGRFDLIFIDHVKELYLEDLLSIERHELLAPGCLVVADNVGMFAGADAYLDHVRTCGRYTSMHHDATVEYQDTIYDMVEVSTWLGLESARADEPNASEPTTPPAQN